MEKKELKPILQDAVERELPASQIDLLPGLKERFLAGTGQSEESRKKVHSQRLSGLALVTLIIGALLAVAFVTPQGRALAQNVLQLFTRAERTSFPLPVQDTISDESLALAPTPTLMSVEEAEAQARFDLAEFPSVPEGFRYIGASWSDWSSVAIQYEALDGGSALTLTQSKVGYSRSEWGEVPAEAIVPVKIGDLDGEFVQGTFSVMPGESTATWNPSVPILRLRWVRDGVFFQLIKFGNVEPVEDLNQAGMIALAESLVYEP